MQLGSRPTNYEDNKIVHLCFTEPIDNEGYDYLNSLGFSLDNIKNAYYFNVLPNGFAVVHIDDAHPPLERWQVPVTSNGCFWSEANGVERPKNPYRVKHWEKHAFWNDSSENRRQIFLEYDKIAEGSKESDFKTFDSSFIPELKKLIDKSKETFELYKNNSWK